MRLPGRIAFVALTVASTASGSVSIAEPFDKLVTDSTAVAVVTPVSQTAAWESGRIYSFTSVHVDEQVAGEAVPGELWVRTLGGTVGDVGQRVEGEPVLVVGRPSLLFLRVSSLAPQSGAYVVTARAQGQFPVVPDDQQQLRVRRSSAAGATVRPKGAPVLLASDVLHGLKVHDAEEAIRQAWSRLHAP